MRIDFGTVLRTLDGEPMVHLEQRPTGRVAPNEQGQVVEVMEIRRLPLTLAVASVEALLGEYSGEQVSGNEKLERYDLARRIKRSPGEEEVTAEEVATLKNLLARRYPPLIMGQAWELLEGKVEISEEAAAA